MNELQAQLAARILLHNTDGSAAVPDVDHVEYCGRGQGSVLGNPFTSRPTRVPGTQQVASRDEAILRHRDWMREELRRKTVVYRRVRDLARLVAEGKTICLICFCLPLRCHTETIREAVAWYAAQEGTSRSTQRSSGSPQQR